MKKTIAYINTLFPILFLLFFFGFAGREVKGYAYASCEISTEVTATYFSGFNEKNQPVYSERENYFSEYFNSGNNYAKDIVIRFTIEEATYYRFTYTVDGEDVSVSQVLLPLPADGSVAFSVDGTGLYRVTCTAYDENEQQVATETVSVKSDRMQPILPTTNAMEDWLSEGDNFDIDIDWTSSGDLLSGMAYAFYELDYIGSEGKEIKKIDDFSTLSHTHIIIAKSCELSILLYDKAGNAVEQKGIKFDKFDSTIPPSPTYTLTPLPKAGSYAKEYTLQVFYPNDPESGLKETQYYRIKTSSGVDDTSVTTLPYVGDIVLDEQKNYRITLYSENNAGQKSAFTEVSLSASAFDQTAPYVDRLQQVIDLTDKNGFAQISFIAVDYDESGVDYAEVEGSGYIFSAEEKQFYRSFVLYCDWYSDSMTVLCYDKVQNCSSSTIPFVYFTQDKVEKIKEMVRLYRETDFSLFHEQAKTKILSLYAQMNNLLNTDNNSDEDFNAMYQSVLNWFQPIGEVEYIIAESPTYVSSVMSFEIDQEDFQNETYGNTISVQLNKGSDGGLDYIKIAGFDDGFSDFFTLTVTLNGESLHSQLKKGIKVTMNMPAGYLNRKFVLIDQNTGKKVATETDNNSIVFTVYGNSSLALVVSGSYQQTAYEQNTSQESGDTVTVFDRKFPKGAFYGIVFGTGGAAFLLILILTALTLLRR